LSGADRLWEIEGAAKEAIDPKQETTMKMHLTTAAAGLLLLAGVAP
jgi:hypothetical protein